MDEFRAGRLHVLSSCELISEGLDVPGIHGVILLRPTKSLGLYMQQVGRALRPFEGKEAAIILDHVGNIAMHGLPSKEHHWSLDGRKKRKKGELEETIKQCPQCYAAYESELKVCPECGFFEQPVEGSAEKEIEFYEGELVEVVESAPLTKWQKKEQEDRAVTYKELLALGKSRGYKKAAGWAWHIMKERR
jgi:superfamily II DNA or RNA helicase